MRESPALRIMEILEGEGAKVDYNDPYIPKVSEQRQTKLRKESVKLSEEALKQYDAVIVVTNHSSYDYRWIVNNSKLVVDTRGATKGIDDRDKKIISA
jgi:UDP-N-acetyl-D-glucosamine dehydrogenase